MINMTLIRLSFCQWRKVGLGQTNVRWLFLLLLLLLTLIHLVNGGICYLMEYTHFEPSTRRFQIFCHFAWKTCIQVLHCFDVVLNRCKAQNQNIKTIYDEQRGNYWPSQRRNPEKSFTYNFPASWLLQFFFAILH